MEKDRLYRVLPKDKSPIQPAKAKCVGFISENGNFDCRPVPQEKLVNSAMYLCVRQSHGAEKLLEHETLRGMRYCRLQGYEPLVLLESIGGDAFMEEKALGKLLELTEQGLINVVVLSHLNNLFQFLDHAARILDELYSHDVMVDCVGCGILERGVYESYQRKSWKQEREFRVKLMGLALYRKRMERAGGRIC